MTPGDQLIAIGRAPDSATDRGAWIESSRDWFIFGSERTGEQDARYGFRQLVEIAVRARSPGLNDPFTALNAIDYVGCALALLARRKFRSCVMRDDDGEPRLVAPVDTFVGIASTTFDPLRRYATGHPLVLEQLLRMLATLDPRLTRHSDRAWLKEAREELVHEIAQLAHPADQRRLATSANQFRNRST